MMKRKDFLRVLNVVLLAVNPRHLETARGFICFRDRTVMADNEWVAVSGKVESDFVGLIQPKLFQRHLERLDGSWVQLVAGGDSRLFNNSSLAGD